MKTRVSDAAIKSALTEGRYVDVYVSVGFSARQYTLWAKDHATGDDIYLTTLGSSVEAARAKALDLTGVDFSTELEALSDKISPRKKVEHMTRLVFGKYKGDFVDDVSEYDPDYLLIMWRKHQREDDVFTIPEVNIRAIKKAVNELQQDNPNSCLIAVLEFGWLLVNTLRCEGFLQDVSQKILDGFQLTDKQKMAMINIRAKYIARQHNSSVEDAREHLNKLLTNCVSGE